MRLQNTGERDAEVSDAGDSDTENKKILRILIPKRAKIRIRREWTKRFAIS